MYFETDEIADRVNSKEEGRLDLLEWNDDEDNNGNGSQIGITTNSGE